VAAQHKASGETASAGSEAAQLRRDIDGGATGDKVNWPDPAAAPLGTDEEAAGTRLAASGIRQSRRVEHDGPAKSSRRLLPSLLFISAIVLMAIGVWWASA
jgi:hypothetical protein